MATRRAALFAFPDPVNELAARSVAGGVVVLTVVTLATGVPWLLIPLAYGFWARVLTGPTLSPLGQLATRVIVPALDRPTRPTPGPPKRFAQAMGATLSTVAIIVWLTAGWDFATIPVAMVTVAAFLESAFGLCLGCRVFAFLMQHGVIPERVCQECADLSRRQPKLERQAA